MNQNHLNKGTKNTPETPEKTLTGVDLKLFYLSLSKFAADDFRKTILEVCDWSYPMWLTRISSKTKITKLESEAISKVMQTFKTPNVA